MWRFRKFVNLMDKVASGLGLDYVRVRDRLGLELGIVRDKLGCVRDRLGCYGWAGVWSVMIS